MAPERAVLFIDGSNFYHAARGIGIATGDLDYQKLANKLLVSRELVGIRYYVGQVSGNLSSRSSQQKFLSRIEGQGVKVVKGRIERRMVRPNDNPVDVLTWIKNIELDWDHRDPADRTIVATASLHACPLVTSDSAIRAFYSQTIW